MVLSFQTINFQKLENQKEKNPFEEIKKGYPISFLTQCNCELRRSKEKKKKKNAE